MKASIDNGSSVAETYLTDDAACQLVAICMLGLLAVTPMLAPGTALELTKTRELGNIAPGKGLLDMNKVGSSAIEDAMQFLDALNNGIAQRLARRLARGIAARLYHDEALRAKASVEDNVSSPSLQRKACGFSEALERLLKNSHVSCFTSPHGDRDASPVSEGAPPGSSWPKAAVILEWFRDIIMSGWDGKARVDRFGDVGSAVIVLSELCKVTHIRMCRSAC
jgi:hypothetical protein